MDGLVDSKREGEALGCGSPGWLDRVAIGMAVLCGVHCLLTPVAVVALPILATSFLANEQFHLWMLLFVLPTTGLSIFLGCRKHRDRGVLLLSSLALALLVAATFREILPIAAGGEAAPAETGCAHCASAEPAAPLTRATTWVSLLGGTLLATAHLRNFHLCRRRQCDHH